MEAIEHPSPLVALINLLFAPLGIHVPDHMVFVGLITLFILFIGLAVRSQLSVDNPGKFHDKTVTVEGVVTTSFGIPLVPFKVFRVSDGSAEMLVISDGDRIPGKNARVRVRGEVQEFALLGGRSFGLHLREKSIKYL